MSERKLWIVCPCFFDTESFARLRQEALEVLRQAIPLWNVTFILVDDTGGLDPAIARAGKLEGVRVVSPPYTLGHQGALVYALRMLAAEIIETDYVVTMDSDGEDRPRDLPAILAPHLDHSARLSLVGLARRTERRESLGFKLGYSIYKCMFAALTGYIIRNGNFASYRGWFLKELIHHPRFDQCYSSSFISLPLQIQFVPLPRGTRYHGQSRMSYFALMVHGLRMLMPFTERIAVRGVIASFVLAGSGVALGLIGLRSSSRLSELVFMCSLGFGIFGIFFVILFASCSQSKATSLRRLREWSAHKAS